MSSPAIWALAALAPFLLVVGWSIGLWSGRAFGAIAGDIGGVGLVYALGLPPLGALVATRRGPMAIALLLIAIGNLMALTSLSSEWAHASLIERPGSLPLGDVASWLQAWLWLPAWSIATTLLPTLLPDGTASGWRRRLAWASGAFTVLVTVGLAALTWHLRGRVLLTAPEDDPSFSTLNTVAGFAIVALGLLGVGSLVALATRFRRADPDARRQIAWVVYGAAIAAADVAAGVFLDLGALVPTLAALALVGGLAVAMLRYRLYEIDTVVNRTLVYAALTATLAGTYIGAVLLLERIFDPITEGSQLAVAASTLLVAAAFRPARRGIQEAVDRRFYRRRYDAARTLDAFTHRLRVEVDVDSMTAELRAVVTDAMQPEHVSLWLRGTD